MSRVIVVGLGPIGLNAAKAVVADGKMKLVGLVDIDPAKVGKTFGELTGGKKSGPKVSASIAEAAKAGQADVAIVTTASRFARVADTLRECMANHLHVVSSCEEMSYPAYLNEKLARKIDEEADAADVALLGTGVNPGFVMDFLPLILSSMVTKVTAVKITRLVDASTRRLPLQAKVGATMTTDQFNGLKREGKIGHMGIGESVALLAAGLGRKAKPADVKIGLEPVLATKSMPSLLGTIKPGFVRGMNNTAKWQGDGLSIELDLTMALGTKDPRDIVELTGPVPLKLTVNGGTPGDTATVASLVNYARIISQVTPGLKTMLDMPVGGAR